MLGYGNTVQSVLQKVSGPYSMELCGNDDAYNVGIGMYLNNISTSRANLPIIPYTKKIQTESKHRTLT